MRKYILRNLEEGHIAAYCRRVVDKSQCCFRYGSSGHNAAEGLNGAKCITRMCLIQLNLNYCMTTQVLLVQTVRER